MAQLDGTPWEGNLCLVHFSPTVQHSRAPTLSAKEFVSTSTLEKKALDSYSWTPSHLRFSKHSFFLSLLFRSANAPWAKVAPHAKLACLDFCPLDLGLFSPHSPISFLMFSGGNYGGFFSHFLNCFQREGRSGLPSPPLLEAEVWYWLWIDMKIRMCEQWRDRRAEINQRVMCRLGRPLQGSAENMNTRKRFF